MVGRPQKRTQETRNRILDAARALFRDQGFDATSVDQIATVAEVAKGTVFAHFTDKTGLLTATKVEALAGLLADVRAAQPTADTTPAVDRLMGRLTPWLALFREDKDFARLFLDQTVLAQGPWSARLIEICCGLEEVLEDGFAASIASGELNPARDPKLMTQGTLAFFYHVILGYGTGQLTSAEQQEALLRALLAEWLG